jgi:amino-acid N-acetyltransferase
VFLVATKFKSEEIGGLTLIGTSQYTIRKARLVDVPEMMPTLNEYARQAEILPRTEANVFQSIRDWAVAEVNGKVVGMGSLTVMWHDLAEIRSLVIDPNFHGQGLGRKIVGHILEEAQLLELPRVFALTRKPGFFLKMDFQLTRIEDLPRKVQKDCVFCPKFHACDEVALIKYLNGATVADLSASMPTVTKNGVNAQPIG